MNQEPENKTMNQLAAIRVRGLRHVKTKIEDDMKMLRLFKNNYCVILPNNSLYSGMLRKAKDYITWGEIDEETLRLLVDKRGDLFIGREIDSNNKIKYNDFILVNNKKIKRFFRLNPPKKGFGRKGIKTPYQNGGALGYRGNTINNLIKRMI